MADGSPNPAIIVSALLIILGIIHFGVGVGIVARYRQYGNTFQQSVGLCAFNIVVGLFSIAVGIVALVSILTDRGALSKVVAIMSAVLAVFALASLIAGLAINSQAISFVRTRLQQYTNAYAQDDSSMQVTDKIQTKYQCCGVNLWLDWASISLGVTSGTGSTTQTGRRRRRHPEDPPSFLTQSLRLRRQTTGTTSSTIYNLPSSYTFNLPLSCCVNGGTTSGNSVGGYCVFSSGNSSNTFYLTGCLPAVANLVVSQITGVVLINTLLVILAIVFIPLLIKLFPENYDPNNPKNQPSLQSQVNQEQQQQSFPPGVYPNGVDPNVNYGYAAPPYVVYQ